MAYTKKDPYLEGKITYYNDAKGNSYKNDVLVPESNYKYLPTQIGGTRGVVDAPVDTGTDTAYTGPTFNEPVYGDLTNDALGKLQGMIDKPWDPESVMDSTQYKALRQEYNIAGQESFQNTLGELSSMTGGRPSSAAVGSAATAMNRYNQQFAANVLPGLTEQSYNQYQKGISNQADLYNILADKDLNEYDRNFKVAEWEWNNSEDNPTVRGQILNNMINEFTVEHQDEKYEIWKSNALEDLRTAEITNNYLPGTLKLEQDSIRQQIISSQNADQRATDRANKEKEEDIPPTATQLAAYNQQLGGYRNKYKDDLNQALIAIDEPTTKGYLIQQLGQDGYDKLAIQLNKDANAEPEPETEPVYGISEVKSSVDDMLAKIGTEKTAATIDNNGVRTPATTYTRAEIIPGILQTLKSMVERGQITGEQADTIASIRGITDAEVKAFSTPTKTRYFE